MGRVISKSDALTEMVKAHENKDDKRAKKIAELLSHTIIKEDVDNDFIEYIDLDRQKKQLFPKHLRISDNLINVSRDNKNVVVQLDDGSYEISVDKDHNLVFEQVDSRTNSIHI